MAHARKNTDGAAANAVERSGLAKRPARKHDWSDDKETTVVNVRINKQRKAALEALFDERGLSISTGLRMVAYEWLDANYV